MGLAYLLQSAGGGGGGGPRLQDHAVAVAECQMAAVEARRHMEEAELKQDHHLAAVAEEPHQRW